MHNAIYQNCLALDYLLVSEGGVCGKFNQSNCCVQIHVEGKEEIMEDHGWYKKDHPYPCPDLERLGFQGIIWSMVFKFGGFQFGFSIWGVLMLESAYSCLACYPWL